MRLSRPDFTSFSALMNEGGMKPKQKIYSTTEVDSPPPLADSHPNRRVLPKLNIYFVLFLLVMMFAIFISLNLAPGSSLMIAVDGFRHRATTT